MNDLGDIAVDLFPSIGLRQRAWTLRDNFTAADALFVALAESLDEPLVTKDGPLAAATSKHKDVRVRLLAA